MVPITQNKRYFGPQHWFIFSKHCNIVSDRNIYNFEDIFIKMICNDIWFKLPCCLLLKNFIESMSDVGNKTQGKGCPVPIVVVSSGSRIFMYHIGHKLK